jgi:signal transduction histidine kinase
MHSPFASAASRIRLLLSLFPAFYQARWFEVTCVVAVVAALAISHRLRVQQLTARMRDRLEERAEEQIRTARILHDTLLQGLQGLVLRFHFAAEQILKHEPARAVMEEALKAADRLVEEGRDRGRSMRSELSGRNLAEGLAEFGTDLNWEQSIQFSVIAEGSYNAVSSMIEAELYFIGREAIDNAFRHANASHIQVEIISDGKMVQLRCDDDGLGIDPETVNLSLNSHWGFARMREHAGKIGARFECWSAPGRGTGVSLTVAATLAGAG